MLKKTLVCLSIFFTITACSGNGNGDNADAFPDNTTNDQPCARPGDTEGQFLLCGTLQLSVDGKGYFILSGNGAPVYARTATFQLEDGEFISTAQGAHLQGQLADANGNITGGTPTAVSIGEAEPTTIRIDQLGVITGEVASETVILGQIILASFSAPFFLTDLGGGLFAESFGSGLSNVGPPNSGSLGMVAIGELSVELDNTFNLLVDGSGYFAVDNDGEYLYTNNNEFTTDSIGLLIDLEGHSLQGYPIDFLGNITSSIGNLFINSGTLPPQQTGSIDLTFNLNSAAAIPTIVVFDALNPLSYNESISLTVYDSRGESHTLNLYFVKTFTANTWNMHAFIDGVNVVTNGAVIAGPVTSTFYQLSFTSSGILVSPTNPATLTVDNWVPTNGAAGSIASGEPALVASDFVIRIAGSTQFGASFSVGISEQDGYPSGSLVSTQFNNCGLLTAMYSNAESIVIGQLILASFPNSLGLIEFDATRYKESAQSGSPTFGIPCIDGFGVIGGDLVQ
ncbi:MAG: flagellar hook-basal body complex protein [Pseudomonadales bacterium]